MQTWFDAHLQQKILDGIYSADDVRSNNICCLSKLWQLRLALLSNVALLVWCHSRYFPTFIGHGKQRKYQNYFQCTKLATCIPGKRLAFNKIMGLEKKQWRSKGEFSHPRKNEKKESGVVKPG